MVTKFLEKFKKDCVTSPGLAKTAHKHTFVHMYIDFNMTPFSWLFCSNYKNTCKYNHEIKLVQIWIIIVGSYGQRRKLL